MHAWNLYCKSVPKTTSATKFAIGPNLLSAEVLNGWVLIQVHSTHICKTTLPPPPLPPLHSLCSLPSPPSWPPSRATATSTKLTWARPGTPVQGMKENGCRYDQENVQIGGLAACLVSFNAVLCTG